MSIEDEGKPQPLLETNGGHVLSEEKWANVQATRDRLQKERQEREGA